MSESLQQQWRRTMLRYTLRFFALWCPSSERLLFGTGMLESGGLQYLRQIRGPALGVFQMEPATLADLWKNYLAYHEEKADLLERAAPVSCRVEDPICLLDMWYATVAARLQYLRFPEPLPAESDLPGLARYWKTYWNTAAGKGTEQQFMDAVLQYEE